ncbi:hypothetical protein NR800_37145 [Corallococcus interemptor]|uniref:hypothetical protein n=1 Tax=Corallococcus interemptor TaxID=2316720 RepID=UPI0035D4AA98
MEMADEEPVEVAEAARRWMLRLAFGRADEELGGAARSAWRKLDEAVVHVLTAGDAHL